MLNPVIFNIFFGENLLYWKILMGNMVSRIYIVKTRIMNLTWFESKGKAGDNFSIGKCESEFFNKPDCLILNK